MSSYCTNREQTPVIEVVLCVRPEYLLGNVNSVYNVCSELHISIGILFH